MDFLKEIWGEGNPLTPLQMSVRALVTFVIGLVLIRFTGRRSFGMRMAFDNVITIMLGAILGAGVTGRAPYLPVLCASAVLCAIHRLFAWLGIYSYRFGCWVKGEAVVLYKNGKMMRENMRKVLVTEEDFIEGVRLAADTDNLDKISEVYLERDGQISVVKKKE
jgi:uncharacterized membrane protein YcaP (DUF421 family)